MNFLFVTLGYCLKSVCRSVFPRMFDQNTYCFYFLHFLWSRWLRSLNSDTCHRVIKTTTVFMLCHDCYIHNGCCVFADFWSLAAQCKMQKTCPLFGSSSWCSNYVRNIRFAWIYDSKLNNWAVREGKHTTNTLESSQLVVTVQFIYSCILCVNIKKVSENHDHNLCLLQLGGYVCNFRRALA